MQIYPYLFFNGKAEEAMAFYHQVLGGDLEISRFSQMPESSDRISPGDANRVMNAQLKWDEGVLMASDTCTLQPATGPMDGCSVTLQCDDVDRAAGIFDKLGEGGAVIMPWAPTFWSTGFGMCKDRFGVMWMINGEIIQ